ncbi:MAG TPA: transketolase C-terminal domain-containing protein [Verrucomicrobiae bacterium]|nr:transketolase C-terminal domain-containing protein [Verrucomicrobiae bacterium]
MRDHFVKRLSQIAAADSRIMLLTADLGFGVLTDFAAKFPKQFLNVGVAEQNMTGVATGMAMEGLIVFTYSIGNFPTLRCLEQIRNDAAYHEANVKIVSVGSGFSYGALGMSHHATEDISILRAIPGITIFSPGDLWEAMEATEAAVKTPGPCYLRLDKSAAGSNEAPNEKFGVGEPRLRRHGNDIAIITTGGIVEEALKAADTLATEKIQARVLSIHTIRPLRPDAILAAARQTRGIITLEEHTVEGGLGGLVAETLLEHGAAPRRFKRMGLRDGFSSIVGSQAYLRARYELDAPAIVQAALAMVGAS